MSVQTYSTTINSGVNKIWRKVQGDVADGLNFKCEEWGLLDEMDDMGLAWSLREVTFPVDITEGGRLAQIPEAGYEGIPYTPNAEEVTLTPTHYNARFAASKLAMWVDKEGGDAQIEKQLKFQGMKAVDTMARGISDDFYGFSTSILALTDTDISGTTVTITLSAGYGLSGITSTSFIADKFRVNDRVAILDAGTYRVTGTVSSITSAAVMVLVLDAAFTTTTNSLQIVRANAVESTQTSYNRGLTGLLDICTSASVQGLSTTSIANWSVAYSDTASGRFSGNKIRLAKDAIANYGPNGAKPDVCFLSQGVYRDLILGERSSLVQNDAVALQLDGDVKSRGLQFFKSRRVPPGYAFVVDRKGFKKWQLLPKPGSKFSWADGKEQIDQSAMVFAIDLPIQTAVTSRKCFSYFSSQQES